MGLLNHSTTLNSAYPEWLHNPSVISTKKIELHNNHDNNSNNNSLILLLEVVLIILLSFFDLRGWEIK